MGFRKKILIIYVTKQVRCANQMADRPVFDLKGLLRIFSGRAVSGGRKI